ncbi:hypothetical protein OE88DRAFT_1666748 [Heliocybe sulcata]|uniref:Thioesterase domain-containing protein n=1 Tax=Heliocybe sulcata TaxID=5364 RepID=A0A5C3MQ69_9AGAM|nr:hypothetical protein OE88DRAFT_1666748 [Heliocybe sulcata]
MSPAKPPINPLAISLSEASQIRGNVSPEVKQTVASLAPRFAVTPDGKPGFASSVGKRLKVTEVSLLPNKEERERRECRVVVELAVEDDMLNGVGTMHGGCSAFLIDNCSTMPLAAYSLATNGPGSLAAGVSQALNIVYHAPALLGDRLRIVSTTIAVGARVMSARCEVWNDTRRRLVVSGVHVKMEPSAAKL